MPQTTRDQARHPSGSISLYIPCFNGATFLQETLQGVFSQSLPPSEVIVVDDGSGDSSTEIASRFPVRIVRHDKNRGLATTRNTAVREARGEFIACVDADTIPDPQWLETLMGVLATKGVVGAGGRLIERFAITVPDAWRKRVMRQHHGAVAKEGVDLFGCNSVIRAEAFREIGGYDEECLASFDDIDFSNRLRQHGFVTAYTPEARCYHSRRDTIYSVVDTVCRWRLPPFEMRGAYRDPRLLSSKWVSDISEGIKELRYLIEEGLSYITYPTFYALLGGILFDLIYGAKKGEIDGASELLKGGYLLLQRALALSDLDRGLIELTSDILRERYERSGARAPLTRPNCTVEECLAEGGCAQYPGASFLQFSLGELGMVLEFDKKTRDAIAMSSHFMRRDLEDDFYGNPRRSIRIVSSIGPESLALPLEERAVLWRGDEWSSLEVQAEVRAATPRELLFDLPGRDPVEISALRQYLVK